jgi:hypothetical protein
MRVRPESAVAWCSSIAGKFWPIGSRLEPGFPLGFQCADHLRLAHHQHRSGGPGRQVGSPSTQPSPHVRAEWSSHQPADLHQQPVGPRSGWASPRLQGPALADMDRLGWHRSIRHSSRGCLHSTPADHLTGSLQNPEAIFVHASSFGLGKHKCSTCAPSYRLVVRTAPSCEPRNAAHQAGRPHTSHRPQNDSATKNRPIGGVTCVLAMARM